MTFNLLDFHDFELINKEISLEVIIIKIIIIKPLFKEIN